MIFRKSFWTEYFSRKQSTGGKHLVAAVISVLFYFCYFILSTISIAADKADLISKYGYTPAEAFAQAVYRYGSLVGMRQSGYVFAILLAVVAAISGFSWMFSKVQIDFFESQPVRRGTKFFRIWIDGVLIMALPYIIGLGVSMIIAACSGLLSSTIAADALIAFARILILYLAVYSISILACVWTGTRLTAWLMSAFLLFYEICADYILYCLAGTLYKTFYLQQGMYRIWLSPIYNYMSLLKAMQQDYSGKYTMTVSQGLLRDMIGVCWKGDLVNLVIAALVLAAAYRFYMVRRNESAGKAAAFAKLAAPIKFLTAVAGALVGGMILTSFSNKGILMPIGIVFGAAFSCCIMQALIDLSMHSFFRKVWHIIPVIGIAGAIFAVYRFDLTGYDKWVPNTDKVESAVLVGESCSAYYDAELNYLSLMQYAEQHMYLTDIVSVTDIAKQSQDYTRTNSGAEGWYMTVMYRMKNGKKAYRTFTVPYDIDPSLMDNVIGSEYVQGIYQLYDMSEKMEHKLERAELTWNDGWKTVTASESLYREFAEAYKQDLQKYSFSMAQSQDEIGCITLDSFGEENGIYSSVNQTYQVYPCYSETISFLKKNGLWVDEEEELGDIQRIRIYRTLPDDFYTEYSAVITDEDEIRALKEILVSTDITRSWKKGDRYDSELSAWAEVRNEESTSNKYEASDSIAYRLFTFRAGEAPQFVTENTELFPAP